MAGELADTPQKRLCGVLCLNKPQGITSRDAVNLVQRWTRGVRVGHAGTLDPLATGLLIVCVGPATRLIPIVQDLPKRYRATLLLGRSSPTDDVEGEVTTLERAPMPTRDQIERVLPEFVGRILQRPPVYSAVKIRGRRGYEWARQGDPQLLPARPVEVYRLELVRYEYPELELEVSCGKGTYIRSLGRDLAERWGTAAVMSALTRVAIGHFTLAEAVDPRGLERQTLHEHLLEPHVAVKHLPQVTLEKNLLRRLLEGQWIKWGESFPLGQKVAILDETGHLAALAEMTENQRLRPSINLVTPPR